MLFGVTPFSAAAFSANPDKNVYVGVTGFDLLTELGLVQVSTAYNINVTVFPTGSQLTVNLGNLVGWATVDTSSSAIWTEIAT
jgi:hypothetical protein